jgi:hypothetical protein
MFTNKDTLKMIRYSPPDGFIFTAENIEIAKEFYDDWIEYEALHDSKLLVDNRGACVDCTSLHHNMNLPWTVIRNSLYVETPLPKED